MPIIAPLVGAAVRTVATRAAGPLLARGASAIAGRTVSAAQLARVASMTSRAARVGATASRMSSFAGSTGTSGQSVEMEAKPLPTLKSPTMAGEVVNG